MRGEVMLGILGGSGVYDMKFAESFETVEVDTPYGKPSCPLMVGQIHDSRIAFLARHGREHRIPAHKLPHKANIKALWDSGVRKIIATSSVGSLKREIRPGSYLVPDDFFSPWNILTFFDSEVKHVTPSFDDELRDGLIETAKKLGLMVHEGGTYVQTMGPRLETKAEIRAMAGFGDVVGMTAASEATLANELGMGYASICMVDNYCHGVEEQPLTYERIVENQKRSASKAKELISAFLGEFA